MGNLTSLANVKAWVGVTSAADDALLTRLIGSVSRTILAYLQRDGVLPASYSDIFDGTHQRAQMLRRWPVLSISSLNIDGQAIGASPAFGQTGYWLDPADPAPPGRPQSLALYGRHFAQGRGNIAVVYQAGYAEGEAQTVPPGGGNVTTAQPYGAWGNDLGVKYATGAAMTPVSASPAQGQYSVATGVYTFAAADAGLGVLLSYGYVPADIEDVCISLVGERYSYRSRIGQTSKSLGGQETISYSQADMPAYVKQALAPYRAVVPL